MMEKTDTIEPAQTGFQAFISYSHADAGAVRKLHSKLESYRLPKGLGPIGTGNRAKGRLGKFFRDREDLSAAHDLSQAIRTALDQSEVLLVACSPAAKASPWVGLEIDYFRERHPGKPILAAVLDGELEDAFPAALTSGGREPLAADFRPQGDGWRLGFLKLVSGIADVPLDTLVQRDSQRQVRRVMAITGVLAFVALFMGVMTTIAIQARDEARFQQSEADGLVAYMLDDLRTQLEGVGRQDVMEGVNRRALEYFANQPGLNDLSPDRLELWARALHRSGADAEDRGQLEEALAYFRQAYRTTEELLRREPVNPNRVYAHAQSAYYVGYIAWERQLLEDALQNWQVYRDLSGRLRELEPQSARSFLELGYSDGNLCTFHFNGSKDLTRAEKHCSSALDYLKRGREIDPQNRDIAKTLANRSGWLARVYADQKRYDDALALRRQESAIMAQLAKRDGKNKDFAMRRSWALAGEAELLSLMGEYEGARTQIAQARRLGDEVLATDPGAIKFLSSQLQILIKAAQISDRIGDGASRQLAAEALDVFETIKQIDPDEAAEQASQLDRLSNLKGDE